LALAIKIALDFGVSKQTIIKTVPKIKFEGRVQYLTNGKLKNLLKSKEKLLIDGCHSVSSAKNLYKYIKTLKGPIYGIWGMQKNKLPDLFIKSFKNIFKRLITISIPNEPNALTAKKLESIARKYMFADKASNIQTALKQLSSEEKKTIVIFGSLYLIGDVLNKN
jgi:dihydrofolate synthase/folylpolyglutamate synthase